MRHSHLYRWSDNIQMQRIAQSDSVSEAAKISNLLLRVKLKTY